MADLVVVTGAAGFAGSHLLDLLAPDPPRVIAWRRPGQSAERTPAEPVAWAEVELLDREAVRRTIASTRPDVIYHCAGAAHVGASWDDTRETLEANVLGTHHLLEALRLERVPARVLIPGSAAVYRPADRSLTEEDPVGPTSPYAFSKLAQEALGLRAANDDGQAVVVTRSFNHVGPRQDSSFVTAALARQIALIEAGRQERVIKVGNIDARRDLTDVRDTVRAYQALATRGRPGIVYNVCSGRAHAVREILDGLIARARVPVSVRVDPSRYRPNDTPLVVGSNARVRAEVGWTPAIPLEQTLDDLLAYWRERIVRGD